MAMTIKIVLLSQHAGGVEKVTIQFDVRTRQDMPANYAATKSVLKIL